MFVAQPFKAQDLTVLQDLIRAHPLGTWVSVTPSGLDVNHVPFLLDPTHGPNGALLGHVARANPIWQSFSRDTPSVVVFQGPETYITPSWYPSKKAHGKAVPTWNYTVVHARGMPQTVEDRDWLRQHVSDLSQQQEAGQQEPWQVSDAPDNYIDAMLKAVVGIVIPIDALEGQWKNSQNRPPEDVSGTVAGLRARGDAQADAMADLVQGHVDAKDAALRK
jgi:transcriptional regulator